MARYDDISKIAVTVTVNHTQRTITAKRNGERSPVSVSYAVNPSALAGAYRDAAAYFLELAAQQERMHETGGAYTLREQTAIMLNENKGIFE